MFRNNKKKLNRKTLPPPPSQKSISHDISSQNPQNSQNSILNTIKDGFSFGVGSSIGHRVVNGIFGDKKEENINDKKEVINESDFLFKKYNECIKNNDISECLKILEKNKIYS